MWRDLTVPNLLPFREKSVMSPTHLILLFGRLFLGFFLYVNGSVFTGVVMSFVANMGAKMKVGQSQLNICMTVATK